MIRKFLFGVALVGILGSAGCNHCKSWCNGHSLFSKSRQCCPPQPCCPPSAVPAVPANGAYVAPPPPATSGFAPGPVAPPPPAAPGAGY
jgi:hypothetical protein